MARAPNEKQIKFKELYDKGYKLIDISKELNTAESTIRVWKNRFKWDNENCNVTVEKKKIVTAKKEPIADEVKEVMENDELTDEQRLFCVIYAKRQNAAKAYQKVYHCTYETAMVNGSRLLRNAKIREQIDRLLESELNKEVLKRGLIQQYKDIAFSDIGDYLEGGRIGTQYKEVGSDYCMLMEKFINTIIFTCQFLKQFGRLWDAVKGTGCNFMLLAGCEKENFTLLKVEIGSNFELNDLIKMPAFYSLNIVRGREKTITTFISKLPEELR